MNHGERRMRREEDKVRIIKEQIGLAVAIIALIASIGGPFTAWAAMQERLKVVEKQAESFDRDGITTAKHETIIPILQQDIQELKQSVRAMSEKQDRQFEALMKALKS